AGGPLHRRRVVTPEGEAQVLAPARRERADVLLLARVLLGDLQLDREAGGGHRTDHGGDGLTGLKVQRAVLDLHDHVVVEAPVQWCEMIISGTGAVSGPVAPVLTVVVDEGAPEHFPAVRSQGTGPKV